MKAELETLIDQMINKGILLEEAIKEFEKKFILSTLKRHKQNLSKSALALGIHRNTLSKRLSEYQLVLESSPASISNLTFPQKSKKKTVRRAHE